MPSKRKEHRIEKLSQRGVDQSFPRRLLFYDSESYVAKPESPRSDDDLEFIPHAPRLIRMEYWKKNDDTTILDSGESINSYRQYHSSGDFSRMPDGELDTRFAGAIAEERIGRGENVVSNTEDSDDLCHDFWERVSDCALEHNSSRLPLYILGHNVGYDQIATGAYHWLPAHRCEVTTTDGHGRHEPCKGWVMETPYSKGPVYIQRAHHGAKCKLIILSSTNFFTGKLKDVAKDMGVPEKLEYPEEKFWKKDLTPAEFEELDEYCRRDVEIVRRATLWICAMLRCAKNHEHDVTGRHANGRPCMPLGPFRSTISSIAFSCWRYGKNERNEPFLDHEVNIHTDPGAIRLERAAFCGGRTEADFIGEAGETHCLDVNNLYGSVMSIRQVPRSLRTVYSMHQALSPREEEEVFPDDKRKIRVETLRDWTDPHYAFAVIAQVYVDMKEPAVPFKDGPVDKPTKLLFPVGKFNTTLCGPELELAFAHGTVLDVGAVALYEQAPIFSRYVDFMSEMRKAAEVMGHKAERRFFKDCNNHVYGKFGQQSEEWERFGDVDATQPVVLKREWMTFEGRAGKVIVITTPMGMFLSTGKKEESYHAFPAIAAFITSHARAKLWSLMQISRRHGQRNLLYKDTDSLMVNRQGYNDLKAAGVLDESELGKLKQEWAAVHFKIEGAKWYSFFVEHEQHQPDKGSLDCQRAYQRIGGAFVERGPTTDPHFCLVEKHKGIKKDAKIVQTPDGPRFYVEQWPGFAGHMRDGDIGHFHNIPMFKKATVKYEKGDIGSSGWVTAFVRNDPHWQEIRPESKVLTAEVAAV